MLRIGKVEVLLADDGPFLLDGGSMFGVVPRPRWEREWPVDAQHRIRLTCNCWLLRCSGRLVLVDAGMGRDWDEQSRAGYGLDESTPALPDNLDRLGVRPEDVATVLLTHLHFDHCGWALRKDAAGRPQATFPNAEYLVHELEWADAHDATSRDAASYEARLFDRLQEDGRLRLLSGAEDIPVAEGLRALPAGGHTRGHLAWLVDSGGHRALGPGDLCPLSSHRRLRWLTSYDQYPVGTLEAKRRLLGAAESGGWPLLLNHDPVTPAGLLRRDERGRPILEPLTV
jgi:glyoxylase-like metal-dependent hydrolase (beta-lactamase superfamily II)